MPQPDIVNIRFRPPVVLARLGNSDSPLEAYSWAEDPRIPGGGKTVIVPEVSLEVLPDGSIEPYLPGSIRFRDAGGIRPVCPFLELEAEVKRTGARAQFEPLTTALLEEAGIKLAQISFAVTAANLKAQRRTDDPACGFDARAFVLANNHARRELWAWSHAASGE